MKKIQHIIRSFAVMVLCIISINALAWENLCYTLRYSSPAAAQGLSTILNTINEHGTDIQVLVSQAYRIDVNGNVQNTFNPQLLNSAKQHHIKFMPLVSNPTQEILTHGFLQSKAAQQRAIQSITQACLENHLYGVQIDFENVSSLDKSALTKFYQTLAKALHQKGFAISIAITPRISEDAGHSAYQLARYTHWTGAFDYKALGASSDFVTLMAYDQHEGATTPGPIASVPWSEAVVKHALKYIPAQKISLGIPTYSGFWKTARNGKGISARGQQIEYAKVQHLLNTFQQTLHWDNVAKVYYTFYEQDELNEFIFAEEARSFAAKYDVAKKYHLRGVSVWRLGIEDPKIWEVMRQK